MISIAVFDATGKLMMESVIETKASGFGIGRVFVQDGFMQKVPICGNCMKSNHL